MQRQRPRIDGVQALLKMIVAGLTLYLVVGVVTWTWMIMSGTAVPDAFATVLAATTGVRVGTRSPLRAPGILKNAGGAHGTDG